MDKNQVEKIELSHLEAAANDYLFTCEQQHDYQVKSVVLMRESVCILIFHIPSDGVEHEASAHAGEETSPQHQLWDLGIELLPE